MKNKNEIQVSVIIPVYMVEHFLRRCVDSVIAQSLRKMEIILVDDGSIDCCGMICDEYADSFAGIYTVHKNNGGLSSARNTGMKISRGKYIFFIDSDDWIEKQTLRELFEIAEEKSVDFVRYTPVYENWPNHKDGEKYDDGDARRFPPGYYDRERIEKEILPRALSTDKITMGVIVSACRSLYRFDFLSKNGIMFFDDIRYSEDSIFSAKVVHAAKSFYSIDGGRYYHYCYNGNSITKAIKADRWDNAKRLIERINSEFGDIKEYNTEEQRWRFFFFLVLESIAQKNKISDEKNKKEWVKMICDDSVTTEICKNVHIPIKMWKLLLASIFIRFKFIRLVMNI